MLERKAAGKSDALPALRQHDTVAIDPGKHACAVAVFNEEGALTWVGHIARPRLYTGELVRRVVLELPSANGRATPPDDLIAEAAAGCALAGRIASDVIDTYTPAEWKGGVPKPVHHCRLWHVLTPAERGLLGGMGTAAAIAAAAERGARDRWSKSGATYYRVSEMPKVKRGDGTVWRVTHDALDAEALGMWYLGRLAGPGGVRLVSSKGKANGSSFPI